MISVRLQGRIGNQLFMYAVAEAIRKKRGENEVIVFYDNEVVIDNQWKNSLKDYAIDNVVYTSNPEEKDIITRRQELILRRFYKYIAKGSIKHRYFLERLFQPFLNLLGIVSCIDGYTHIWGPWTKHVWINGYFQSEKYFHSIAPEIKHTIIERLPRLQEKDYVRKIIECNSVCISIKVEHNVGSSIYDVCGKEYYTQAIEYIVKNVENPLFFICSDNVPYVLEHLIDADKYDYICQEKGLAVSDALTIMSACKHFIIGNTSFGWWAQYLSSYTGKIVIAPNRWYRDKNMIAQLYDSRWHLIDVQSYIDSSLRTEHIQKASKNER